MNPKETALITGASSGIGYELAKCFAKAGHPLVLTARNVAVLETLADELRSEYHLPVRVLGKDLSKPNAPEEIFREVQAEGIEIDILVNNAGFGTYGLFCETSLADELEMLQVNMGALTHLAKLFLPGMLKKRGGRILNVASTAAFQPGPMMAVYYATKAYILSFSEALREELRGTGVSVSVLCPGPTRTPFQGRAGIERIRLLRFSNMDAAAVARRAYEGLMRGEGLIIPGFLNWLLASSVRFFPRGLVTRMVREIQVKTKS